MKMMNKLQNSIPNLSILVFLIATTFLSSCKDQDVLFKEYVVEGGITYLGRVTDLTSRIGLNRLEVNFTVVDAKTTQVGIYWNDYSDSVMVPVGEKKNISKVINLPEGQYSLFVKSFDKYGNSSNVAELITYTVGDNYLSSLSNRGIKSKSTSFHNDLTIEWLNPDPVNGARFTKLYYISIDGTEKMVEVDNGTSITTIDDYKQSTPFRRITYYNPDNLWLDTITPPKTVENTLMIDKKLGTVKSYSSQNGSYKATNIYNGNYADTWLTNNNYPEHAVIDLGREIPVCGFGVWPSYQMTAGKADPRAPTKIKFESSTDNTDWTTLVEIEYDNSMYYYMRYFEAPLTTARYVKFTGVECSFAPVYSSGIGGTGTTKMSLSELDVFFQLDN